MITPLNIPKLVERIQVLVDELANRYGIKLEVVPDYFLQEHEWYTFVVAPLSGDIRAYDYVEVLQEAEETLQNEGYDKVILVPAMPS